jgi:hypothetical protein
MAEERLVHGPQTITFEGLFSIKDINKTVFDHFTQQGYVFFEKIQTETVTDKGKTFVMKGDFIKKLNYYANSMIPYKISGNIVDVEIIRDNHKQSLNKGKVTIEIEGVLKTDLEGRFEVSLMAYLLRVFSEVFFFKRDIDVLSETVSKDFKKALSVVRGYLNLQKYN